MINANSLQIADKISFIDQIGFDKFVICVLHFNQER